MIVARSAGPVASASARHPGLPARAEAPRASTSVSSVTPGPASLGSNAITWRRAGSRSRDSTILARCAAFDTRIADTPASRRMYSI